MIAFRNGLSAMGRVLLGIGLLAGSPAWLQAQHWRGHQQGHQQNNVQPVQIHGTIQDMGKGAIAVLADGNRLLRVMVMPMTKVQVTGTTTPSALRAGMFVEFVAELDSHSVIQGKIGLLNVVSFSRERPLGVFPSGEAKPAEAGDAGGEAGDKGGADAKAGAKAGAKNAKHPGRAPSKPAARASVAGTYRIVGQLTGARGSEMSVRAGHGTFKFVLADQPTINVNTSDLSIVSRGSEVSVQAVLAPNKTLHAHEVTVKLPEMQGDRREPPAKKTL
jgi:hypothetical protein